MKLVEAKAAAAVHRQEKESSLGLTGEDRG